ncbi:protein ligase NEDD4-like [Seminavis robusta]|uniref:Protein ligase NEDD4-like n=1 Tax=Seminavis robusta TaxID=568900 RepID=A0A9N8HVG1_9STRA|nr:protein ligase NEDD4-like [Seminavis robusta]|eukprot:Sro1501_g277900.1 protein ligase NEDD4-like (938) ;mRNA; f:11883-14696
MMRKSQLAVQNQHTGDGNTSCSSHDGEEGGNMAALSSLQSMDVIVSVLRGEGLAPKDKNWKGEATSSDPYVIVKLLSTTNTAKTQQVVLGKTETVSQSLNPVWDEDDEEEPMEVTMSSVNAESQYALQFTVMDEDDMTKDDLMGIVTVPISTTEPVHTTDWYTVPPDSAKNATGKLKIALQTKLHYDGGQIVVATDESPAQQPQQQQPQGSSSSSQTPEETVLAPQSQQTPQDNNNNADGGVEYLELDLTVIQGQGLAAKDRDWKGKRTTSDPYIEVTLLPDGVAGGPNELSLGLTQTIHKTLCPVWQDPFYTRVPLSTLKAHAQLRLTIKDWDEITEDDCMGIVHIPLMTTTANANSVKWYDVPATSAKNATGKIQCALATTRRRIVESPRRVCSDAWTRAEQESVSANANNSTAPPSPTINDSTARKDIIDSMNLTVTVLAGAGLAAKDRNIIGKRTTSDPYVHVKLLTVPPNTNDPNNVKEINMGKTQTVPQSLAPVWNERFETTLQGNDLIRANEARLQLTVYDRDITTKDDCMGVVTIPVLLVNTPTANAPRWYGIPSHSAKNAAGRLQIQLDTTLVYASDQLRRAVAPPPPRPKPNMVRLGSARKLKLTATARSRDTSAFCTPRRTRPKQGKLKSFAGVAPLAFGDSTHNKSTTGGKIRKKSSPSAKDKGITKSKNDVVKSKGKKETRRTESSSPATDRNATSPAGSPDTPTASQNMADEFLSLRSGTEAPGGGSKVAQDSMAIGRSSSRSRFSQQKARSKDTSAFCTPRRIKPKAKVSGAAAASSAKAAALPKFKSIAVPMMTPEADNDTNGKKAGSLPTTPAAEPANVVSVAENSTAESSDCSWTKPRRRQPSILWKCTCGSESEKSSPCCSACGANQFWTCAGCSFRGNICVYQFCGMCGKKRNEKSAPTSNPLGSHANSQSVPLRAY